MDELDAGDAGADDGDALGENRRRIAVAGRQDPIAVGEAPVGDSRPGPGGDQDRVGRDRLGPALVVDGDLVRAGDPGRSRGSSARPGSRAGSRRCSSTGPGSSPIRSRSASIVDLGPLALEPHAPTSGRENEIAPPVAIIVFDGMQSSRWAAPPTMSRSIIVTWAPRRAACVAAVFPAGPPPMITNRKGTWVDHSGR